MMLWFRLEARTRAFNSFSSGSMERVAIGFIGTPWHLYEVLMMPTDGVFPNIILCSEDNPRSDEVTNNIF